VFWEIQFYPKCTHHVFLSHCAEDRNELVFPLFERLRAGGIIPWLDRHDYPYGRNSRAALRDAILSCRHVAFLITDAMLASARGWCVQELAWAELLQDNLLQTGGPTLLNVSLPLYFVRQDDPRLPRSVWQACRDKGPVCPAGVDRVGWAFDHIRAFLERESRLATELRQFARTNPPFRSKLQGRSGFRDRVTRFDPQPLPPPPPTAR
jgi:hypothetical protein